MKILFLDCETSDITPLSGQIIEVGGVIAELDAASLELTVIDQFESLVKIRKSFDDKITRITGITEAELQIAPNILDVQEKWADWLEKYEADTVAICGHSIDFDVNFLRSESWFLPAEAKIVDTLELAKILFTRFSAINLEFLIEKLNLLEFIAETRHQNTLNGGQAHRALFDTWCSAGLLQSCLRVLKNTNYAPEFHAFLSREILPLGLQFYSQESFLKQPQVADSESSSVRYIDLDGLDLQYTGSERITLICKKSGTAETQALLEVLQSELSRELKVVTAAVYSAIIQQQESPQQYIKLHIFTQIEKQFVEILLDFLERKDVSTITPPVGRCVVRQFENILWQIKQLSEEVVDIGKLVTLLEIYQKISASSPNPAVQTLLSSYDFFLLTMEAHWASNHYQFWYRPRDMLGQEAIIKTKFAALLESIYALPTKLQVDNPLEPILQAKLDLILSKINKLMLRSDRSYQFRLANQKLVVSLLKDGFSLNVSLENLFNSCPDLEVQTYLAPEKFETLLKVADIQELFEKFQVEVNYLNGEQIPYQTKTSGSLIEMLQARQLTTVEKQAPVLILTGNNLTLKKVQKVLTDNFNSNDYLALGESGSLTKVCSKLARGFVGLVNVRIGDFGFLNTQNNLPPFAEIWLVGQPFIFVQQYWQNLAKQNSEPQLFSYAIQDLNLHSQTGFIFHETGQTVNYFPLN